MLVKAIRVLTVGVWAATSRFLSRLSRNTLVNLVMLLFMMWLVTFYEMVKYRAVRVVRLSPSLSSSSATPSSPSSFSLYTAVAAATVSLPCLKMEHLFHTRHLTLRYTTPPISCTKAEHKAVGISEGLPADIEDGLIDLGLRKPAGMTYCGKCFFLKKRRKIYIYLVYFQYIYIYIHTHTHTHTHTCTPSQVFGGARLDSKLPSICADVRSLLITASSKHFLNFKVNFHAQ